MQLLCNPRTALFCSARTPADAIRRSRAAAKRMREDGKTVISGFHSTIEKECLQILLRGNQPIIICPARAIEEMRIPGDCRAALDAGRLLLPSPFIEDPLRATRESAILRNEFVAALADSFYIAHMTSGGETARIAGMLNRWGVPAVQFTSGERDRQ